MPIITPLNNTPQRPTRMPIITPLNNTPQRPTAFYPVYTIAHIEALVLYNYETGQMKLLNQHLTPSLPKFKHPLLRLPTQILPNIY